MPSPSSAGIIAPVIIRVSSEAVNNAIGAISSSAHRPKAGSAAIALLSAFACGDAEFGSSGLSDSAVSPKLAESGSAHRRVDAGDEPGVERALLGGRKAFAQFRTILDSEDYGRHARDGERVAMGEYGR
jgi:hypothetical protein